MIRIKKEDKSLAKKLFKMSFSDSELDKAKIQRVVELIKKEPRAKAVGVLSTYLALIKNFIKKETLLVEAVANVSPTYLNKIKNYFEGKMKRRLNVEVRENPSLLGGVKIIIGDTAWDLSVKGRIDTLKESLHGKYS